jgi:hypothetical protein
MQRFALACALFLILSAGAAAQSLLDGVWPYFRGAMLPRAWEKVYELRAAIRGFTHDTSNIDPAAHRLHDLVLVDSIYFAAVDLCDGNIREAVFVCSVATLPYHSFPAVIPLTGIVIRVPVSTESRAAFERRMTALPGQLFADTPSGGDRDKLPHFFGSTWLYLMTRNDDLVHFLGHCVEFFESVFKLEGSEDERDIHADDLGAAFGRLLLEHADAKPSEVLGKERGAL